MASEHTQQNFYVPEIHDVYPGMEAELDAMLGVLPESIREDVPLLVVPHWQMAGEPLPAHEALCSRLRAHRGEIVLHGLTHSLGPDLWNWLMYGHDNRSEFAKLDRKAATLRLGHGIEMFEQAIGRRPEWFCAPRWQQSVLAGRVLSELGMSSMLKNYYHLSSDEVVPLPALCFDEGERRLRNAIARQMRELTIKALIGSGRPFRLTLHPNDVHDAATWRQVKRTMERLDSAGWQPVSLATAIGTWREARGGAHS